MNKEELRKCAHVKINKMKVSELKEFLGINQPVLKLVQEKIVPAENPEPFNIDLYFSTQSYNNTQGGRNSGGGDLYTRARVHIKNQEFNNRELEISVKWLVPSGYGDGNISTEPIQYMLTDKDIFGMKEQGTRDYLKALFQIPYTLHHRTEIPYTIPVKKKYNEQK